MKMTKREYVQFLIEDSMRMIRLSYFMLLGNCVEMIEGRNSLFDGVRHFEREIIGTAVEMERILKKDNQERQADIDRILALKEELTEVMKEADLTDNRIQVVNLYLDALRGGPAAWNDMEPVDTRELLEDCSHYVATRPGEGVLLYYASSIMALFPLKMAREKYYEYIRHAITHNYGNDPAYMKALIKQMWTPEFLIMKEYRNGALAAVNESLMEVWTTAHETSDFDSYEKLLLDAEEQRMDWRDRLSLILDCMNYCLIVMHYAVDLDIIMEDDFMRRDISAAFVEHAEADSIELFAEVMSERLDEIIEVWLDERFSREIEDMNVSADDLPEEVQLHLLTWTIINKLFDENQAQWLAERLNAGKEADVDDEIAREALDAFIDCMKENLSTEPPKKQRVIKQYFLGQVPCGYMPKEWTEYLEYVYESVDERQKRLITTRVYDMFEENYFNPINRNDMELWAHND